MNTSDEKSKYAFYLSEKSLESREEAHQKHLEKIQIPLNEIVVELKENGGWQTASFKKVQEKYGLNPGDRAVFLQELQRHNNIIARLSMDKYRKDGQETFLTPLEYKYVEKEIKEELGIDAVFYRKITQEYKDKLKKENLSSNLADFLAMLNYFITEEAEKGWISPKISKMLSDVGISCDSASSVIKEMERIGLLVYGNIIVNNHIKSIYTLTETEEDFINKLEEIKKPEEIKIHEPVRKTRNRRRKIVLDEEDVKSIAQKRNDAYVDYENFPALELLSTITEKLKEEMTKHEEKELKQFEIIEKLLKESEGQKSVIDSMKTIIEKKNKEVESLVEFNNSFIANAQHETTIMSGRFINLIEQFSNLQHFQLRDQNLINKYRGEAMEIIADTYKKIIDFKKDKFPPDLKN